ncbi:MAG TPA: SPOR domain-containing protein [Methylophilaceae bacterium]|nr:SPOR domain-containing protein [Methylophilaceae bacterium]
MKLLVWVLVLLNVLLFAYFNLPTHDTRVNLVSHKPIEPEKIKLLTEDEVKAMPRKAADAPEAQAVAAAPPPQFACYEWGSFSAKNLPRARNILTKFSVEYTTRQQNSQEAARWWIYIPRLASVQAAQAKVAELKALGVEDMFVVQEPQWKNVISFGVFKDEQLATKLLEELKAKGVVSAVNGVRNQEKGQSSLLINKMSSDIAIEIDRLKPDFPGSELKQVSCQ